MDIDIDFKDRRHALNLFDHVVASRLDAGYLKPHNSGIYITDIPSNPFTGMATLDYKSAERRGYIKIDFLNVRIYDGIRDENHLNELINREPIWELLEEPEIVDMLYHLNGHSKIVCAMKPRSLEQLAMILALIRPAKRHLVGKTWSEIEKEIWEEPSNGEYYFKKSHSHSYAMAIIVQLNLICEEFNA